MRNSWRLPEVNRVFSLQLTFFSIFVVVFSACNTQAEQSSENGKLKVVATTTIVGDVVDNVGGDFIESSILLPVGTDPHSFNPTPQDIARVADADVVFANGVGLESFLNNLIESAGAQDRIIYISEGIDFLDSAHVHDAEISEIEDEDDHETLDPHTWTNALNVLVWVENIEGKLSRLDPDNADTYKSNASTYIEDLEALDVWIREQVDQIPNQNRKIVTDHAMFGYFASAYGFQEVGALIPGFSTLAQPSAQDLAQIEDTIRHFKVNAIFVGKSVNPTLAERIAEDTGTRLSYIYTGSLSDPGGDAGTYLDYMRYNTLAFVEGLK